VYLYRAANSVAGTLASRHPVWHDTGGVVTHRLLLLDWSRFAEGVYDAATASIPMAKCHGKSARESIGMRSRCSLWQDATIA
jgi:hypothetical protein